jgi:hypothetical protein
MNYINNWQRPITLGATDTSAALDLPDGAYRLTLSDAARAAFEYVDAIVVSGAAQLTRALEGSAAQAWPAGSVIYCSVTAGVLAGMGGADSGWVQLAPLGGSSYAPEARLLNGVVHLRGFIYIEAQYYGAAIAKLPAGWRPGIQAYFHQTNGGRTHRVTVDGLNGFGPGDIAVSVLDGSSSDDYAVFDGIAFPAG